MEELGSATRIEQEVSRRSATAFVWIGWIIASLVVLLGFTISPESCHAQVITPLSVDPRHFSPNGDGVKDTTQFFFTVEPDSVRLIVRVRGGEINPQKLVDSTYTTGTDSLMWDGKPGPAVAADAEYWFVWEALRPDDESDTLAIDSLSFILDTTQPDIVEDSLLVGEPIVKNGDSLSIRILWDEMPESLTVAFDSIDTGTASPPVIINSQDTTWIGYRISLDNPLPDGSNLPLSIAATDSAANSIVDKSIRFCLANVDPPTLTSIAICDSSSAFALGDTVCLDLQFATDSDTIEVVADLSRLDAAYDGLDSTYCWSPAPGEIRCSAYYHLSGDASTADGTYAISVFGRDRGCQESNVDSIVVGYDGTSPQVVDLVVPDTCVVYGQTVVAYILWDDPEADYTANFSALHHEGLNNYSTRDSTVIDTLAADTSVYAVYEFTIPTAAQGNDLPDSCGYGVDLSGVDSVGNSFSRQIRFCLNNYDPAFLTWEPTGRESAVYHNGESLELVTYWDPSAPPAKVTASFSQMDTKWSSIFFESTPDTGGIFILTYQIASDNEREDGTYSIPIEGRDADCGVAKTFIQLTLDNTPPPETPTLDPLPRSTRESVIVVSGRVAGAPRVEFTLNGAPADTVPVEADSTFAGSVTLAAGGNLLVVYGMDEAGNRTVTGAEAEVFLTGEPGIVFPHRFRPGESFELSFPRPAQDVSLEIRNLAGDLLRTWRETDVGEYLNVEWNGKNLIGETVKTGPYLAIIEVTYPDGGRDQHVKPFVFSRQ